LRSKGFNRRFLLAEQGRITESKLSERDDLPDTKSVSAFRRSLWSNAKNSETAFGFLCRDVSFIAMRGGRIQPPFFVGLATTSKHSGSSGISRQFEPVNGQLSGVVETHFTA
jgi:hypothetical protein